MNQSEILQLLEKHQAVKTGHFVLSSGRHSDTYVQCALVLRWPRMAERLGHELGRRLAGLGATIVVAPAVGGLIIGHEVARELGVPLVFTERVDGAMTLRRGLSVGPRDRVVVVEDVVTTGGSPREAMAVARAGGAEVVGVGSIVDRSGGAASFGVRFEPLYRLTAQTWEAGSCPLCADGQETSSPGSRRLSRPA